MTFTFNFNGLNFNNLNLKYIYFNQYIPIDINDPDIGDTKQRKVTKMMNVSIMKFYKISPGFLTWMNIINLPNSLLKSIKIDWLNNNIPC